MREACKILVIAALVGAGLLRAQNPNIPVYPGAIATDSELLVTSDAVDTTLSAGITATATTIPVTSAANITVFPALCWVDQEVVKISGKSVNDLTVASDCPAGTCPTCAPTTTCRGWGGPPESVEASHAMSARFVCGQAAQHHNIVAAEVKAIQQALGTDPGVPPNCDTTPELTISGGTVTVPKSGCYLVDTEADAPSDDLDSVTCAQGVRFWFLAADDARTIVLKNDGVNMRIGSDWLLNNAADIFSGWCLAADTVIQLARDNNGS